MSARVILDTYVCVSALRIRWYARASARTLLRHWQWFLLAGLLVPGTPLIALPGALPPFLLGAVSPGHDILRHALMLAGIQCAALLWMLPQRRHLAGGRFAAYTATLPISPFVRRSVDLTLLLVADSPIAIMVFVGFCAGSRQAVDLAAVGAAWVLVSTILMLQLAMVEKRPAMIPAVAAADLLCAFALASGDGMVRWLALLAAVRLPLIAWLIPDKSASPRRAGTRRGPGFPDTSALLSPMPSPVFLVQRRALTARPFSTAARLAITIFVAVGADKLISVFRFDGRAVPTAIGSMAVAALVLSGLYRTLREAHTTMQCYMASLPMPPRFWPVRDTRLITMLGFIPFVILLLPLISHGLVPSPQLAVLAVAYAGLIALLGAVVTLGRQLSVLLAVLFAAGWTGAAIAAIAR